MIPGPVLNGIQSYYGCPRCGGWGGGGKPGGKGSGYIDVPSRSPTPQPDDGSPRPVPSEPQPDYTQEARDAQARRDAAAAKAAEIARQFERDKNDVLSQLKGFGDTNLKLKDSSAAVASIGGNGSGLKEINSSISGYPTAASIHRGIHRIQVPPPIPPEIASIGFGQLAKSDERSRRVLEGLDGGTAVAQIYAKINGMEWPAGGVGLILMAGKSFIAAEDAADVYIVKKNESYDQALAYQRNPESRKEFALLVRALREHQPISENVNVGMLKAAQAILDPALGNSSSRIAWDAMMSPEARHAAMTRACIETGGIIIGQATDKFKELAAIHDPPFKEAQAYLKQASAALTHAQDPAEQAALRSAIKEANDVISQAYLIELPNEMQKQGLVDIFTRHEEKLRTQ